MFDKRVVCIVELLMLFFISTILDKRPCGAGTANPSEAPELTSSF